MRSFPQFFLELFWRISANGEIGRAFSRTSGWKSAVPVPEKKRFHPRGIKIISAPKARPHRAAGAHEAHIGPDRALRRVNDAFIRVPTAEYTRAVHLSVLPLNSATEGAEFKFVLRTARQVERMSVAQDRREG